MKVGKYRLLAVFGLWTLLSSARALAEPDGYRAAIDEAISEFSARRFEEAHTLFARAHSIQPNARTLRGLGLAEFELRDYVACVQHLDAALKSDVRLLEGDLRSETEALRNRAAGFVARVTVRSQPQASRLFVDGMQTDTPSTQPLLLSFGTHNFELIAAGYEPERRSLQLTGGEERLLDVEFQRPFERARPAPRDVGWYENPWLWVAVGAIVVGGSIAGVAIATTGREPEAISGGTTGVVIRPP